MIRTDLGRPALTFIFLGLVACGENSGPVQPVGLSDSPLPMSSTVTANAWTMRAPLPQTHPRYRFGAASANNGAGESIVYLLGGDDGLSFEGFNFFGAQTYNVATDSWGSSSGGVVALSEFNGVTKIGNRLFLTGGNDYGATANFLSPHTLVYDLGTGRVTGKADMPIASWRGVSGLIAGRLYVLPGDCDQFTERAMPCAASPTRQLYRYDPAANVWSKRPWAPHFHALGAAGIIDGKLYVAGGRDGLNRPSAALDVYDPATNRWVTRAPMPAVGEAVGTILQGKLFVVSWTIGGDDSLRVKAFAYDPIRDTWKAKPAPPIACVYSASCTDVGQLVSVTLGGQGRALLVSARATVMYTP